MHVAGDHPARRFGGDRGGGVAAAPSVVLATSRAARGRSAINADDRRCYAARPAFRNAVRRLRALGARTTTFRFSVLRFLNPLAVALTYIVLWRLGVFSIRTAAAFAAWNVVVAIVVFRPVYPRHGLRGRAMRSPGRRSGTASAPKSLGSATRSSPGVRLVYGDEFGGSVRPLLYLLPGCVLWAASSILFDGMLAVNRPLGRAVQMGVGLVLNVSGLVLFLAAGGIEAAAIVSSISYGIVFIPAAISYRRIVGLRWREFFPSAPSCAKWPRRCSPIGARSPAARGVMRIRAWSWLR
jgi:hypothetical protein